jgi:uncharacterized protein (DUF849 family)
MRSPTILSCAVTGNITTVAQHPGLPCTPEQIANACIDAARAGAAIVHIHVRYPDGRPSMELAHYREVVARIRASDVDVVINLTTGAGGRYVPSEADPRVAGPGSTLLRPELRVEHIVALRPEMCSLDLNTMYSGTAAVINTPRNARIMAALIREAGTLPELEVFDSGDIHLALDMIADGSIASPALFQIVLGVKYGANASTATMSYLKSLLPADANWAAFGIGRWEYTMLAQAFILGGHVRVGLEDNIYIEKGVLAPDNAALVRKAVNIVQQLGGTLATPAEARDMLGMVKHKPRD